jgi:hypothetical protein
MTELERHFVKPLADYYGKPAPAPFIARLAGFGQDLSPEALEACASQIIDKSKTFPTLDKCKAVLQEAERRYVRPAESGARPWDTKARDAADWRARKRACEICRCALGEQANREGWLVALIDWVSDHGRLPQGLEIDRCKALARRSENALADTRGAPFFNNLVAWRKAMLDRAHKDVFGEAA